MPSILLQTGLIFDLQCLVYRRTDSQFIEYIKEFWVFQGKTAQRVTLSTLYPSDQINGFPLTRGF
jgi:hypothetical protein